MKLRLRKKKLSPIKAEELLYLVSYYFLRREEVNERPVIYNL